MSFELSEKSKLPKFYDLIELGLFGFEQPLNQTQENVWASLLLRGDASCANHTLMLDGAVENSMKIILFEPYPE